MMRPALRDASFAPYRRYELEREGRDPQSSTLGRDGERAGGRSLPARLATG
jgi:hypothetical protein